MNKKAVGFAVLSAAVLGGTAACAGQKPDAAAATAAFDGLSQGFAACAAKIDSGDPSTGIALTGSTEQTVAQPGAQCWSLLAARPGTPTPNGGTLDHDCFARSGDVIEEIHLGDDEVGTFTTQSLTTGDATLIPELQHDLGAYSR
jgi:hypothetical protein